MRPALALRSLQSDREDKAWPLRAIIQRVPQYSLHEELKSAGNIWRKEKCNGHFESLYRQSSYLLNHPFLSLNEI